MQTVTSKNKDLIKIMSAETIPSEPSNREASREQYVSKLIDEPKFKNTKFRQKNPNSASLNIKSAIQIANKISPKKNLVEKKININKTILNNNLVNADLKTKLPPDNFYRDRR